MTKRKDLRQKVADESDSSGKSQLASEGGSIRDFSYEIPPRRSLRVFAFDPMLGRAPLNRITIEVPNEPLSLGPIGSRLEVIDYDSTNRCFYPPIDLEDPALLMQNGMEPTESDPRFHQQMVYAVGMKVIENFEAALGRRLTFRRNRRLRLLPHAFNGANAFYDSKLLAILFGYFRADAKNAGPNLPGQTVFSCLSQDIIAHEMTHALVDRLRHYFMEATNRDVLAFHEGFADIVAIFQHFSFPAVLKEVIQETRSGLHSSDTLLNLAQQFGYSTGKGRALRSSTEGSKGPDASLYEKVIESHERGAILVAAVFDAFFTTYQQRIRDLIRIATGGTGTLPKGDLHPDLVNRIAIEAAGRAQSILRMCIRAFDYLPPVDVTFGDYLRALVTADYELSPADENGQRAAMIEAFRIRGIYPSRVSSLAQESVLWERAPDEMEFLPTDSLGELVLRNFRTSVSLQQIKLVSREGAKAANFVEQVQISRDRKLDFKLQEYATRNAAILGLDPNYKIALNGFQPVFRVSPLGELVVEMVAHFTSCDDSQRDDFGGIPLRGGVTLIASAEGKVRYVVSKAQPSRNPSTMLSKQHQQDSLMRYETQRSFVEEHDLYDPLLPWCGADYFQTRISRAANFNLIHLGVQR